MTEKLEAALNNVQMTYNDIVDISNNITGPIFEPINSMVADLNAHINSMTVDMLRDSILRLQLKAFEISEIKEKSVLKAELAESLQKEKYAINFNGVDGSAAVKDKLALIATSEETISEILYNVISNLFKNKVDQLHRLVAALTTILMSRMQETKYMNLGAAEDPDAYKTRIQLNEENSRRI